MYSFINIRLHLIETFIYTVFTQYREDAKMSSWLYWLAQRHSTGGEEEVGIAEGDFTSWMHKWTNTLPEGMYNNYYISLAIDERSDVVTIIWLDSNGDQRIGIFNLSDFSTVFLSTSGSLYTFDIPSIYYAREQKIGHVCLDSGGFSTSIQSYLLLLRRDGDTIEVWRGGSSVLWSHDTSNEEASAEVYSGIISLLGKWVLVVTKTKKLILYEGS